MALAVEYEDLGVMEGPALSDGYNNRQKAPGRLVLLNTVGHEDVVAGKLEDLLGMRKLWGFT